MDEDPFLEQPLVEALKDARNLLSDIYRWTQNARARDIQGNSVQPASPRAMVWDVEGAVALYSNTRGFLPLSAIVILDRASVQLFGDVRPWAKESALWAMGQHRDDLIKMFREIPLERVVEVNDVLGHAAVLLVLDRAIELAVQENG